MITAKWVILWTDGLIYLLVASVLLLVFQARRKRDVKMAWAEIFRKRLAVISIVVVMAFVFIGLLDSIHFRRMLPSHNESVHYSPTIESVFDNMVFSLNKNTEKTYSAPFAQHLFIRESVVTDQGTVKRDYPRLQYGGAHLGKGESVTRDIVKKILFAGLIAGLLWWLQASVLIGLRRVLWRKSSREAWQMILRNQDDFPWLSLQLSIFITLWVLMALFILGQYYHVFGTSKVGMDVLYLTLKSIRTGLVIGTLTTLIMLPFAIALGISAGYFGGRIDDAIQYLYTTLSSIPGVLLIAAAILSLQVFIANHSSFFHTLDERADARLLALCAILGLTSWTGLCRLLRAETLKVREIDYIQAARALGSRNMVILFKHILPNVMHIVLIAVVLDFSALVLAEAVLSYVGVGVDPSSVSWGNMINSARLELAREPVVWWPLLAAFSFMFVLVLSANLFADAVRDGFDPRNRHIGN